MHRSSSIRSDARGRAVAPSPSRPRDAATGLLATAALLAIVVGVPVALVKLVGWPLPVEVPAAGAVGAALRYGHIAPGTLLKALAVVVWVLWLLLTLGIGLELLALARGTVAPRLSTLVGLQHVCARLLTAAMLLSTLTTRPAAAVAAPTADVAVAADAEPAPRAPAGDQTNAAPDDATWVVRRHDSLWTIAERTLGAGERWREIRDRNVGRPQPGGGRLRAGDTMIHPGWVLRLPPDAMVGDEAERVEVERGDHLWGLAEAHLGDGARWRELYARNRGVAQPDGGRLTRPDVLQPGWVLSVPRRDASDRSIERHREARSAPPEGAAAPGTVPDDRRAPRGTPVPTPPLLPGTLPGPDDPASPTPSPVPPGGPGPPSAGPEVVATSANRPEQPPALPIAGSALLATGLVAVLTRRRRQWLRRRRAGAALDPVDAEAAELERWLRSMADHDLSHRTDRMLRLLTEHFAEHGVDPAVLALQIGERVTLLLSHADPSPPPGLTVSDDGRTWLVDAELEVAAPRDDDGPPLIAARVGCGSRPGGEIVVLNLMEAGVLDFVGAVAQVEEALTSWIAELASGGAANGVELVVVGRHHHLVEQFARVVIAADARAAHARVDRMLDTAPVVVLSTAPIREPAWDLLRQRAADDPRLALVAAWDAEGDQPAGDRGGHRLRLDGDQVLLDPPGLRLAAPEWLTPRTWDRYGDLLSQPVRESRSDLVPSPLLTSPLDRRFAHESGGAGPDVPSRMVRVLGPLTFDGLDTPDPLARDVLAYLAVHGDGVRLDTLAGEVAPGASGAAAVRSTVAALREGDDPAVVAVDGLLRLADGVGCDLERFHALTRRLDDRAPADQAGALQAALALLRGRPFDGCGAWADVERHAIATTALVSDVAHRLATVVMTFGDLERAAWAVDRGLLASPGCELLYRDRMRIADAAGDHAALAATMRDLRERASAEDGWVTPETERLFEQLRRSSTIATIPGEPPDHHAS
jgi:hypothetical protein